MLVIDNAPYHNKQVNSAPTSLWKKQDMQKWLTDSGIPYCESMVKPQLYSLINLVDVYKRQYTHTHTHVVAGFGIYPYMKFSKWQHFVPYTWNIFQGTVWFNSWCWSHFCDVDLISRFNISTPWKHYGIMERHTGTLKISYTDVFKNYYNKNSHLKPLHDHIYCDV